MNKVKSDLIAQNPSKHPISKFISDFKGSVKWATVPEDIPACPVCYPTMEEFQDFSTYVSSCERQIGDNGIFKVSDSVLF